MTAAVATLHPLRHLWQHIAHTLVAHLQATGVRAPDLLVLLPSLRHIDAARQGWRHVAGAGWGPRFETPASLAHALGAWTPPTPGPGESDAGAAALPPLTLDPVIDELAAQAWLQGQRWVADVVQPQPQGVWRTWAAALTATAHEFARAVAALPRSERAAFWGRADVRIARTAAGPGALEAAFAHVALAWAQASDATAGDGWCACLFDWIEDTLADPGRALVVLESSLAEPALQACAAMARTGVRAAVLDLDRLCHATQAGPPPDGDWTAPSLQVAMDAEDEAQRAAAAVLDALACTGDGALGPVALVAQDREGIRRVRALLDRCGLAVQDETGWTLSTTRVAAAVRGLLRLAGPQASCDEVLDLLKSALKDMRSEAVDELEQALRRQRHARAAAVASDTLPAAAAAPWRRVIDAVAVLMDPASPPSAHAAWPAYIRRRRSLAGWLQSLQRAIDALGLGTYLQDDEAGRQLLTALRFDMLDVTDVQNGFSTRARAVTMDLGGFADWVEARLEAAVYIPTPPSDRVVQVLITPLGRLALRPVAAVVMPGCDERRLGAGRAAEGWLADADRDAIGAPLSMATRRSRQQAEACAFWHLLSQPRVALLWRTMEGEEPVSASPLLERLRLLARAGARTLVPAADDAARWRGVTELPVAPPLANLAPRAPVLPRDWYATHYQDLRTCPYRFFALRVLGLREPRELSGDVEKRDYGDWLHAVLKTFHEARAQEQAWQVDDDLSALLAAGEAERVRLGIDEAAFWPYLARFRQLAPAYLTWLQEHERTRGAYQRGEVELVRVVDEGLSLRGTLDRIDQGVGDGAPVAWVLDYKAQRVDTLKQVVRDPLEDTQLASYAALLMAQARNPDEIVRAAYLALDERDQVCEVEHPDVMDSALRLLDGMAEDVRRLREGHGLPALGEGKACTWCAARGLCRRDHWQVQPQAPAQDLSR